MSFVISLLAFLVSVGVLVSFHEFGHYWVARRLNVKVLRFSIGFGKPLWRRVSGPDRTEYVLAAIPLGGYVKMLDEREGPVSESESARAFNRQTVGKRMAIVAAGPAFNFVLAIAAYWLMFMLGVTGPKPIIGEVAPQSLAADSGLVTGDEILTVGGDATLTWQDASLELVRHALADGQVSLRLRRGDEQVSTNLDLSDTAHLLAEGNLLDKLGIKPALPGDEPVFGELMAGQPAAAAGVQPGDRIRSADGEVMESWTQWAQYVRQRPGQEIELRLERASSEIPLTLRTAEVHEEGKTFGRVGAYPQLTPEQSAEFFATVRYNPVAGLAGALRETWKITGLTLKVLGRLVIGEASVRNISGPITIAEFAGQSALAGLSAFLGTLALFSISIGVLNLLPVPVLDGGHLLFYLIEWVRGAPVSEFVEGVGQRIGFAVLAGLITLALYNDITRLMG